MSSKVPRATIVYADDDLELTRLVKGFLEDEGYAVTVANDGEEGLETILTELPDLVILDVMMPGLNGWEIAKYIRRKPELHGLRILMLTGIGPALNELTSPLYGADAHLDKPFDFEELLAKVEELIEGLDDD